MPSAQFDPCRQWLGIDAVELGDPRRVLGLLPSEADPLVVLRAADARLTLLRGIAPGPFDMARNALIKRVEESREAVLAQIAAAPAPVGATFKMPPLPGGAVRVAQPPRVPPGPVAFDHGEEQGFIAVKTRPVRRKQSGGVGGLLLLLVVLAAAAVGLAWYVKNSESLKPTPSKPRPAPSRPRIRPDVDTEPARESAPPSEPSLPPEAPEAAAADESDADAIVPLLEKALACLQDGQFDDADNALGQAGDAAKGKAARARLAHWQALVTYSKGFADLRERALAAVRPGLEYEIDDKIVAIVEIDDSKVIYRYAGKNKTIPRSNIPGKLLLAILKKWFDRTAANQLYLGAYHATKPEPDLEKARAAWLLAERSGADASELLPLLDDAVLVKAAGVAGQ